MQSKVHNMNASLSWLQSRIGGKLVQMSLPRPFESNRLANSFRRGLQTSAPVSALKKSSKVSSILMQEMSKDRKQHESKERKPADLIGQHLLKKGRPIVNSLVQDASTGKRIETVEDYLREVLRSSTPITQTQSSERRKVVQSYVLHCLFNRNNTHLTLSAVYRDVANPYNLPGQEPLKQMCMSTGQVGFKKATRGEVEATYRMTVQFFAKMVEKGLTDKPVEIILRNHNRNRTMFLDVLTGREGARVRRCVTRVTDGTRLRHGGVRPPARRRL
ncbi:uncharacterized protein V1513DRAFT_447778 [Lipomyces chichibuensis]|uniref:uncharacterized protein n=1 Tax=Lipomyces chichibuensis TaxID=1546026 RepID=UPI00334346CF